MWPRRSARGGCGAAVGEGPACGGDLRLRRARAREVALGLSIPAARVVEVAFEDVHDAVQPRRECRGLVLDDLVSGVPVAGLEQIEHTCRVHGASIMPRFSN